MNSAVAAAGDPSHKTIIVLDHGPAFARKSGTEVTCTTKAGQQQLKEGTIQKTMWTLLAESALEFRRVVGDLFPESDKQLCFVLSDTMARVITPNWIQEKGPLSHEELIKALTRLTVPDASTDPSTSGIRNGLRLAVESLSEKTPVQEEAAKLSKKWMKPPVPKEAQPSTKMSTFKDALDAKMKDFWSKRKQLNVPEKPEVEMAENLKPKNRGTIVVFTTLNSDEEVKEVAQDVAEHFCDRNDLAASSEGMMIGVDHLDLHIINCFPLGSDIPPCLKDFAKPEACLQMSVSHVLAQAGPNFTPAVHKTLMKIYGLASTTVTNIPMKEEAASGTSVNYDVELFHKADNHVQLELRGLFEPEHKIASWVRGVGGDLYRTAKLRWCTPGSNVKYKSDKFPIFEGSSLATAVSVNSRPAACLTGFVLGGKNVMLDVINGKQEIVGQPNLAEKLFSHYLCRDEATQALMIQTVPLSNDLHPALKLIHTRSDRWEHETKVNSLPMRHLCKENEIELVPQERDHPPQGDPYLLSTSRKLWTQRTGYFPLHLKDTLLFSIIDKFEEVLSIIHKQILDEDDKQEVREFIAQKMAESHGGVALTRTSVPCTEYNGVKLDSYNKQYWAVFSELAKYVNNFGTPNSGHTEVASFISGLAETFYDNLSYGENSNRSASTSATQSPVSSRSNSPVPQKKRKLQVAMNWPKNECVNLLQLTVEIYQQKFWRGHKDFVGRRNGHSTPQDLYVGKTFDTDPVREGLDKKKGSGAPPAE
ncbi:hypothetical protein L596_025019 [Steinernema carpocapsae]|uniref:Protein asunder n=1 Tax=Steinernema carpocapsae TaxID=34508 RepID=A0A4U5M6J8_STECR|nr:hypothetical protein L596_025019 [Steinernema carpocapsae]